MSETELPDFRWCVYFKTAEGHGDWLDQLAKHPAGAKRQTIDEMNRMGHEIDRIYTVTRTDAKQSRAAVNIRLGGSDGILDMAVRGMAGLLFDFDRRSDV